MNPYLDEMAEHIRRCSDCERVSERIFELQDAADARGGPTRADYAALSKLSATLCPLGLAIHTAGLVHAVRSAEC